MLTFPKMHKIMHPEEDHRGNDKIQTVQREYSQHFFNLGYVCPGFVLLLYNKFNKFYTKEQEKFSIVTINFMSFCI